MWHRSIKLFAAMLKDPLAFRSGTDRGLLVQMTE